MNGPAEPPQPGSAEHTAFPQSDSMHVAGYLAAHERVADGDADCPDDGELWAPGDLDDEDRARWVEGFRSHFEPSTDENAER